MANTFPLNEAEHGSPEQDSRCADVCLLVAFQWAGRDAMTSGKMEGQDPSSLVTASYEP